MTDVYLILGGKTGWIGGKVIALLQEQSKKYEKKYIKKLSANININIAIGSM
jgi:hypothetical protein